MLDYFVSENILGQVSIQLEMTSHDWSRLKTSAAWTQVEQILMESEKQNNHCFRHNQTGKPEVVHCTSCWMKRFFHRFFVRKMRR